jgi:hypothetical protein
MPTRDRIWLDAAAIRQAWSEAVRLERRVDEWREPRDPAYRVHLAPQVVESVLADSV